MIFFSPRLTKEKDNVCSIGVQLSSVFGSPMKSQEDSQLATEVDSLWHSPVWFFFFSIDSLDRHLFNIYMSQPQPQPSRSSSRENRYVNTRVLHRTERLNEDCSRQRWLEGTQSTLLCKGDASVWAGHTEIYKTSGDDGFPSRLFKKM